jgi:hypothetical protein
VDPRSRGEALGVEQFARVADALLPHGLAAAARGRDRTASGS